MFSNVKSPEKVAKDMALDKTAYCFAIFISVPDTVFLRISFDTVVIISTNKRTEHCLVLDLTVDAVVSNPFVHLYW